MTKKYKSNTDHFGNFNDCVRHLKLYHPAAYPVKVIKTDIPGYAGDTTLMGKKKKYFRIRINSDLSNDAAILTLMHEHSHSLSWECDRFMIGDDSSIWGIAYSQVYRSWMETT